MEHYWKRWYTGDSGKLIETCIHCGMVRTGIDWDDGEPIEWCHLAPTCHGKQGNMFTKNCPTNK
jgi:hypothetical protein